MAFKKAVPHRTQKHKFPIQIRQDIVLPHPSILKKCTKIDPIIVERMFRLAESEQKYRHKLRINIVNKICVLIEIFFVSWFGFYEHHVVARKVLTFLLVRIYISLIRLT